MRGGAIGVRREGTEDTGKGCAREGEGKAASVLNDTQTERKMDGRFAERGEGIFFLLLFLRYTSNR